jgi:hypothetical protein
VSVAGVRKLRTSVRRRRVRSRPTAGERCGDQDVAAYLARLDAMKRVVARLAAGG